jgi:hypothetical protein
MTLKIILLITAFLTAMISGFFYAYHIQALTGSRINIPKKLVKKTGLSTALLMDCIALIYSRSVNRPSPGLTEHTYRDGGADTVFYFLLASSIIYVVGVFLITGMGNVPLNESLARINLSIASPDDLEKYRDAFEGPWNKFNLIRTIANLFSLVLILVSLIKK